MDCLDDVSYGAELGLLLGPYGEVFGAFGGAVGGLLTHCNDAGTGRPLPSNDYYDRPHGHDGPVDPVESPIDHAISPVSHPRTDNTPAPHTRTTVVNKRKPVYNPPAPPSLSVIVQERVNQAPINPAPSGQDPGAPGWTWQIGTKDGVTYTGDAPVNTNTIIDPGLPLLPFSPDAQPVGPSTTVDPAPPVPPSTGDDDVDSCLDGTSTVNTYNYGAQEPAELNGVKGLRSTAATACLVTLGPPSKGRPADPFGYAGGDTMHRGHLIGRQFGGRNTVDNIVPLYITPNTPVMRDVENEVAAALTGGHGQRVFYQVTPLYDGSSPIPWAIQVEAQGSTGFKCNVIIRNDEDNSGQRSQCS